MSKKMIFAALVAIGAASASAYAWSQFRWTQVGTQIGGYYGLPMRHCGNDAVGPGECTWQDYQSRQACFMYWGSYDLGNGRKQYPIFQCNQTW